MPDQPLHGQVAIITGGGRGLGRAYALELARRGASVGIMDLDLGAWQYGMDESDSTLEALDAIGGTHTGVELDVTDEDAVRAATDSIAQQLGAPSILITNAGGNGRGEASNLTQRPSTMDTAEMRNKMESNFYSTVYAVAAAAPYMKERRYGKIVTVSSLAAQLVRADAAHADYAAAKAAIMVYTKILASDLGPYGINVNCVAPGLISTPRNDTWYGDTDAVVQNIALRRTGTPEECARAVAFLVSDDASYVTGLTLDLDGSTRSAHWGTPLTPWWEDAGQPGAADPAGA